MSAPLAALTKISSFWEEEDKDEMGKKSKATLYKQWIECSSNHTQQVTHSSPTSLPSMFKQLALQPDSDEPKHLHQTLHHHLYHQTQPTDLSACILCSAPPTPDRPTWCVPPRVTSSQANKHINF